MIVFGVVNGTTIALYAHRQHAEVHARTITGSRVVELTVHESLPSTVVDDIASEEWDEAETPVQEPASDITQTNPSTPRSKAKSQPPENK